MNTKTEQDLSALMNPDGLDATLQSVHIEGRLDGLLLNIKTRQHYKNTKSNSIEAVYTFPLPWGATLLGLNAEIDSHCLKGAVLEKKQATQRYEKAIDDGDTPVMVERSAQGLYTANLGNLKPGEEAVVEIEYVQLMRFEQGQIRITLPTTVAPRYGDAHKTGGLAAHESVSANVLAQYPLTVRITLTGQVARATFLSPSHTVAMSLLDDGIEVSLQQGGFLDRDFVLLLNGLQGQSFASVARDSGSGSSSISSSEGFAVMASFCPELPVPTKQPLCMKVLVDCSGSMAGDSIQAARQALHEVMQELTEQDWISYSRFGSNVQHELSGLQLCYSTTIKQIAKLIDATKADLGGTEMNAALISTFELGVNPSFKASYAKSEIQNNNMDVLLITDGDIWHIDTVVQFAAKSGHRIFAIGVGSAPAESLLREIAEKSGGACELVSPNQNVAEVIVRMFRRMRSTRCTELCVDWGQKAMWQSALPMALYGGDTLHLCARLATMPESAPKLTWVANKIPMHASAKHLQSQSSDLLPRLVASQRIVHLTSFKESPSQALELALKHQLVTNQTNLILVHVREEDKKAEGLPELSRVNHMLAAGWGGVGKVSDLYDVPAFCRSARSSQLPTSTTNYSGPAYSRNSERLSTIKSQKTTLLVILQTFEASAQRVFAQKRFVGNLESLELPTELISLLDNLTVILGGRAKAWAVVLKWMAEHQSQEISFSRQSERFLRQLLQDVDANVLQELNFTWKAKVYAFIVRELATKISDLVELEDIDTPANPILSQPQEKTMSQNPKN